MNDALILGGGFAGVWSAAGAVRLARSIGSDRLRVRLISASDDMVIRPRLYERNPGKMRIDLDRLLKPIGVERLKARVESIDAASQTVKARGADGALVTASYDRLVLATGSQLNRPAFPGAAHAFDIDTLDAAVALDAHLHHLPQLSTPARYTAVVVGAGFTGLEIATELIGRLGDVAAGQEVRVILVERAEAPGPELGDAPRPLIVDALDTLGVERRLGRTVASATETQVTLDDGEVIPAATLIWTVGMSASPLTAQISADRDRFGRLLVDEYLRVTPTVYAAGDTAAAVAGGGHPTIQSCQHAQPMGKYAGHNVAADLLGLPMLPFIADPYSNCIDLGDAGALMTVGWERTVEKAGPEAKAMKHAINTQWIYPPTDSADALLAKAGHFSNSAYSQEIS
ncbi:NADH dehydrogenase-like protein [Mycobacterium sp. THAF192]|nr:NADH dehydrogenase-like protein [Mycobacterium sp. THAF192]